jgi:hypothetical protein
MCLASERCTRAGPGAKHRVRFQAIAPAGIGRSVERGKEGAMYIGGGVLFLIIVILLLVWLT